VAHIYFLIERRIRLLVAVNWLAEYVMRKRGSRIISIDVRAARRYPAIKRVIDRHRARNYAEKAGLVGARLNIWCFQRGTGDPALGGRQGICRTL
jgi:hypothetical protein